MTRALRRFIQEWRQRQAFLALPAAARGLVFYSEGASYWPHFERIIRHLYQDHGRSVVYLTSQADDPVLLNPPPGVTVFSIGAGTVRTLLFAGLRAGIVVMTMPDLHSFYIKRSPHVGRYVYVHHSMASCHMAYRTQAFDHFDAVFCVGPHHVEEIRGRERQAGLPAKVLVQHGYARLETLIEAVSGASARRVAGSHRHVLIAPSWGENALLERHGGAVIAPLLAAGMQVTLRPHPHTAGQHPELLAEIRARYARAPGFSVDADMSATRSLAEADVMVSDWSGAALEFAFARLKPVLFVDVPRKVNNPAYLTLGIEPLEVRLRERIGTVVPEAAISEIAVHVQALLMRSDEYCREIEACRSQYVFNLGCSGDIGAQWLLDASRAEALASLPRG